MVSLNVANRQGPGYLPHNQAVGNPFAVQKHTPVEALAATPDAASQNPFDATMSQDDGIGSLLTTVIGQIMAVIVNLMQTVFAGSETDSTPVASQTLNGPAQNQALSFGNLTGDPNSVSNIQATQASGGIQTIDGIQVNTGTFSNSELTTVTQLLNTIANDPDGSVLIANMQNRGYVIQKDPSIENIAQVQGTTISLGSDTFTQAPDYVLEVLGHEMTHAATPQDGDTKNEEGVANVVGRRIRFRNNGNTPFTYQNDKGQTFTFDGSPEAEREAYVNSVLDARNPLQLAYKDLGENGDIFNTLKSLGINFNFGVTGQAA